MAIRNYYDSLSKEGKATLRNEIIKALGVSLPTFYYKLRNDSFRPVEQKAVKRIISKFVKYA